MRLVTVAVREDGCFGVLCWDGRPFAVTCERTFDDGEPVIRAGRWRCSKTWFNRGGYATWEIYVPGHSRVLFHRGNTEKDSEGCVLVGEEFGVLNGKTAVLSSAKGFFELMYLTTGATEFYMEVTGRGGVAVDPRGIA